MKNGCALQIEVYHFGIPRITKVPNVWSKGQFLFEIASMSSGAWPIDNNNDAVKWIRFHWTNFG